VNVALCDSATHDGGDLVAICGGKVQTIPRAEGEATVHSSNLCHAVTAMTVGERFSLICFFERGGSTTVDARVKDHS
jgi:predicted 2-oxoglutarate/Fe(II)-dependent dioxygenase YbiX